MMPLCGLQRPNQRGYVYQTWPPCPKNLMKTLLAVLLLIGTGSAATGKIVDVQPYKQNAQPQVTIIQGYPSPIVNQGSWDMFTLTVFLNGMAYSASFRAKKGCHATDFIVGDPIEASVDGDKLTITRPDGKSEKAKIVRKARVE
jgi:hypothetical protein